MAHWGLNDEGPVDLLAISDGAACSAKISTFGARLVQLWLPDRVGRLADVVLGHDQPQAYQTPESGYFGATCGRYANRIRNGRFALNGLTFQLDQNEGVNHLHGGGIGYDRRIWTLSGATPSSATFHLLSPDGDMGYPGALDVQVRYAFTGPARLEVEMTALAQDRATIVNLVNHSYFNLAGQGSGPILDHLLQIAADRYLTVDDALLPLGQAQSVADTAFDFRRLRPIGADMPARGFDHNFCLVPGADPAVTAIDPASGRGLKLWTNQPGVQFYTAVHLPPGLPGKAGSRLEPFAGFALETQKWPDSPNHPDYPSATLLAGETYRHVMEYAFFVTSEPALR